MKYAIMMCMLLAGYAYWQHFSLRQSEEKNLQLQLQNTLLQKNQDNLIKKVEEFNVQQQKASLQIAKLKEQALQKQDDCYYKPISDAYIDIVRGTKHSGF
ncbi:MAG: hypothetical protein MR350_01875 [Alphaproteobacteria bacterium]|nr:hypothetical protein [Alphaproteobacteria bacterium]